MSVFKTKIILFFIALIIAIIWFIRPDKETEDEKIYFLKLNLCITGVVKQLISTNEHDHGVIYLEKIKSNRGNDYEALYKAKYLFCKIKNDEAIIVTPGIHEIQPDDSISINTNKKEYLIYRKGIKVQELNPWLNPEDDFYDSMNIKGYLDFSYFQRR
jgi:hypothetical protein